MNAKDLRCLAESYYYDVYGVSESYDLYDIIISHLLDEGYAETPEAAEVIMANMSEDWRESICEAYLPWDFSRGNRPSPRDLSARAQSRQQNSGTPAGQERGNQIRNVRSNMRQGLNNLSLLTGTPPGREGGAPGTTRHLNSARTVGGVAGGTAFPAPSNPGPSGIPSTRIPTTQQLRTVNQAAQSRRERRSKKKSRSKV